MAKVKYPKGVKTPEQRNEYLAAQQAMAVKAPEPHKSYMVKKPRKGYHAP